MHQIPSPGAFVLNTLCCNCCFFVVKHLYAGRQEDVWDWEDSLDQDDC